MPAQTLGVRHAAFREIGQLQIFEEQVHEFVVREGEAEIVLPFAVRASLGAAAAGSTLGPREEVSFGVFLVSRQQVFPDTARAAATKGRLVNAVNRKGDLASLVSILDAAVGGTLMHRLADQRFGTAHEPLTIGEALPPGI